MIFQLCETEKWQTVQIHNTLHLCLG